LSIQQDFYAKIVASNLTALMEIAAQKKVDKRTLARLKLFNALGADRPTLRASIVTEI
jgi:hypothetical protein